MKISFLVTYYNQRDYVAQSLDSILRIEKPCDWEILVGDDGSDDGTTDIVKQYMALYPEQIFLYVMDREPEKKYEVVRRASANRLNLVSHMTGDFFCTLDGDDYFCNTDFIRQALEILSAHDEVSVAAFGYQKFTQKDGVLSQHTLPAGSISAEQYLQEKLFTLAGACVFRNHMSDERKAFLNEVIYFDDNNIVSNNLHFGNIYAVEDIIYAYRQTESSAYNAMQLAERAVLNAQSLDVDLLLLPQQQQPLTERYSVSLLQIWYLRKALKRLLGDEKWERYRTSCSQLPYSLTGAVMDPSLSTPETDRKIKELIHGIIKSAPKMALREFLRCWKHRLF